MTEYQRGFEAARRQCLAFAEDRMVTKSVLAGVLPEVDKITGSDIAREHEWFCKGRVSAAERIAADIRAIELSVPDPQPPGGVPTDSFQCGQQ